jgi:proline racemase/trans-L-3-hydroxyproline dehydratase
LFDDLGDTPDGPRQRNVTVFADGEVDRSPCGSGTSARLVLLADEGRLGVGEPNRFLQHESIIGTQFAGRILDRTEVDGRAAYLTEVSGSAYETARARFTLDPLDPLGVGFVLR